MSNVFYQEHGHSETHYEFKPVTTCLVHHFCYTGRRTFIRSYASLLSSTFHALYLILTVFSRSLSSCNTRWKIVFHCLRGILLRPPSESVIGLMIAWFQSARLDYLHTCRFYPAPLNIVSMKFWSGSCHHHPQQMRRVNHLKWSAWTRRYRAPASALQLLPRNRSWLLTILVGAWTIVPQSRWTSLNSILCFMVRIHSIARVFSKKTHTHGLAFATPTSSGSLHWNDDSKMILQRLVACVRRSNCHTKIVLSIGKPSHGLYHAHVWCLGGWDGCYWWSNAVSSEENRKTFNQALVSTVEELDLDG